MAKKRGATNSFAKRAYLVLRWPVALGLLGVSLVVFFTGLVNSLGYQGTTNLRPIAEDDPEWISFEADFQEHSGAPFDFFEGEPIVEDGMVRFDKRLVALFKYLKNNNSEQCGWSSHHERISIDIKAPKYSDESPAKGEPISLSTVTRGVGARIAEVDFIKCTESPKTDKCHTQTNVKFQNGAEPVGTYPIRLSNNPDDAVKGDDYDNVNCQVTCAYDYFPNDPVDAISEEKTKPVVNEAVVKLSNYSSDPFPIEEISQKAHEGALYKMALLTYEVLHIDEPGCDNADGNTGYFRKIPVTIHWPGWGMTELDDKWNDLIATAEKEIPFYFQKESPLAGLWYDPELNSKGLHINY